MAITTEPGQENRFIRSILPWLIAAAGLLLYLATLNRWISVASVSYIARAAGQMWAPELGGPYPPLLFLATYPFRWLPVKWIPLGLNIFSAVCAAGTLGLLARSVLLLPHDRTHQQRQREHGAFSLLSLRFAWIPPVLAAAVYGLQLSFWESATSICDDTFEVLLFAYVLRCLLEYRIDPRDSWIFRAAIVFGAGMTGNWLMIGLFPVFIASILWIRGVSFFNLRFLGILALCCLGGLLFYLVMPVLYAFSAHAEAGIWQTLKLQVMGQLNLLQVYFVRLPRYLQVLLATTSLLPLLLISVRWSSYFGDPSKVGIAVTTGILHVAHAALLVACIWVAFDPVFSPRDKGVFVPGLYYLGALCVGYFAGYFLLVFRPIFNRAGYAPAWQVALNRAAQAMIWGLLFLVPAGLVWKNLPQLRLTNGPAMEQYASLLVQNLPANALVLCDSQSRDSKGDLPIKLWLAQAWLARSPKLPQRVFADTMAMQYVQYHSSQRARYGNLWPPLDVPKGARIIPGSFLLRYVAQISTQTPVYYLNPTFGYYMEAFYQQPHGLSLELRRYDTNSLFRPGLTGAEVAENEVFWRSNRPTLQKLLPWIDQDNSRSKSEGFESWWMRKLHIPFQPNLTARTLGRFYSQSAEFWAVLLQRSGRWGEASQYFELALALNPENSAAKAGIACNEYLRTGRQPPSPSLQAVQDEIGRFSDWQMIVRDSGSFDDPLHCLIQGLTFGSGHLVRESAQQFERVHEFDPNYAPACLWLARFYASKEPDKALGLISVIANNPQGLEDFRIRPQDVSMTKVVALFAAKKANEAEREMDQVMDAHPKDEALLSAVVQVSAMYGRISNAIAAVKRELEIAPTNDAALLVEGYLQMQDGQFSNAIAPLTRALELQSNNITARFNRAISYLRTQQLDRSEKDYLALEKVYPNSFRIYYGLGEIAWQRKDTNAAIRYYKLYLTNAAAGSDETKLVGERLQSLAARSP